MSSKNRARDELSQAFGGSVPCLFDNAESADWPDVAHMFRELPVTRGCACVYAEEFRPFELTSRILGRRKDAVTFYHYLVPAPKNFVPFLANHRPVQRREDPSFSFDTPYVPTRTRTWLPLPLPLLHASAVHPSQKLSITGQTSSMGA